MLMFLMSCKPHDNIPLANWLWIMYICGRKCSQNFARTWVTEQSNLVMAVAIIWAIFSRWRNCCKNNWASITSTDDFLLHLAPRGGEELQTTAQDKGLRQAWTTGTKFGPKSALFVLQNNRWRVQKQSSADHLLLVHTWVWFVAFHLPKQTAPSVESNLRLDSVKLNERWNTGTVSYVS